MAVYRIRTASYTTAPSQIPACGITAQGSSKLLGLAIPKFWGLRLGNYPKTGCIAMAFVHCFWKPFSKKTVSPVPVIEKLTGFMSAKHPRPW